MALVLTRLGDTSYRQHMCQCGFILLFVDRNIGRYKHDVVYYFFFTGLDLIRQLVIYGDYELRVDLEDFSGEKRFAKYNTFSISDETDLYRLTANGYSGTAGMALFINIFRYRTFSIGDETDLYSLSVNDYSGTAGMDYVVVSILVLEAHVCTCISSYLLYFSFRLTITQPVSVLNVRLSV